MSYLIAAPESFEVAASDVAGIGSSLRAANAAAAAQTTAVASAAEDEVSTAIAAVFSDHAQEFQALSAQAAAFHDEFANLLNGGAAGYLNTEVANARQTLVNAVNAPAQALLGHPLIGTGQGSAAADPPTFTDWFKGQVVSRVEGWVEDWAEKQVGISTWTSGPVFSTSPGYVQVSDTETVTLTPNLGTFIAVTALSPPLAHYAYPYLHPGPTQLFGASGEAHAGPNGGGAVTTVNTPFGAFWADVYTTPTGQYHFTSGAFGHSVLSF